MDISEQGTILATVATVAFVTMGKATIFVTAVNGGVPLLIVREEKGDPILNSEYRPTDGQSDA